MLRSSKDLTSYKAKAKNGEVVGHVRDLLFDGLTWSVRYLVIDTGSWLIGRKTLVAISQCWDPDTKTETLQLNLTKEQIENGPVLEEHAPVSRQYELEFARYFQVAPYWGATGQVGPVIATAPTASAADSPEPEGDPNLRSMHEIMGYSISALDGDLGHLEEFIVDDVGWMIRYLVVDTRKWLPSPKVLIAAEWAKHVSHEDRAVTIGLNKSSIQSAPEYGRDSLLLRDYEDLLYRHYGREGYWEITGREARIAETTVASIGNPRDF